MRQLIFAYPGDLATPTGGYVYDRRVIKGLEALGWSVECLPLGDGFPNPSDAVMEGAVSKLLAFPKGSRVVIDGLAFGVMDRFADQLAEHLNLTALVHHPLCKETGLTKETAAELRSRERKAVQAANRVIVTSPATAQQVRELFSISENRIHVVVPGTERQELSIPTSHEESDMVRLLCVATLTRRKGYDVLIKALADLKSHAFHLDIVGATDRDPDCYQEIRTLIEESGLEERITFHGGVEPDQLASFYMDADVFVLASRYEGYGMAFTEALSFGLPVIGSGGGAVRETLPEEASIYCETENVSELNQALSMLLVSQVRRKELSEAAQKVAATLPCWEDVARLFAAALLAKTV